MSTVGSRICDPRRSYYFANRIIDPGYKRREQA